jgi:serine/threonine-protein kinase HipA
MVGRPSGTRRLAVWMNGQMVGRWTYGETVSDFRYDDDWMSNPYARPISLSMPLSGGTRAFAPKVVSSFFMNLLPDSPEILMRLAARFRAESIGPFDLLSKIGRDCVGAIQLLPEGESPQGVQALKGDVLSSEDVERLLDGVLRFPSPLDSTEDDLRISIAGAQEKTALLRIGSSWYRPLQSTPTTHILKLPLGMVAAGKVDLSTSVENEWLCLEILRAFGMPVARADIETFGQHTVLCVERFDRKFISDSGGRWIARLPQEDFCQIKGLPPGMKYEADGGPGIDAILDSLRGSENAAADRRCFMAAQMLFWCLAAPDGHAKNFSVFLEPGGRFRMTPLYDVMSAWPVIGHAHDKFQFNKVKLAMALRSNNAHWRISEIQPRHWLTVADRNAVSGFRDFAAELVESVPRVLDVVGNALPAGFPESVGGPIFDGMKKQALALEKGLAVPSPT